MDEGEFQQLLETRRLLYDWFKHLTSLSLLAIGGALSLSQAGTADIDRVPLAFIVLALGAGGVCSFSGADRLVRSVAEDEPIPTSVRLMQRAAPALLGMGVGAFLYVFLSSLGTT